MVTEQARKLLHDVLALPPELRAEIASELISSLDRETDEEVQKSWAEEISRRAAAVRRGELPGEDWRAILDAVERDVLSR